MPTLALWTPDDGLLGVAAPVGLGVASRSGALVVDLDPEGPAYPGERSLAELVAEGPRRSDLHVPARPGVAVLRNGGVDPAHAIPVVAAMIDGWPSVVIRLPARPHPTLAGFLKDTRTPVVPVVPTLAAPLWPDRLAPGSPAVLQRTSRHSSADRPGPLLPVPGSSCWASLIAGRVPFRDRWVDAWRAVWRFPWT